MFHVLFWGIIGTHNLDRLVSLIICLMSIFLPAAVKLEICSFTSAVSLQLVG